MDSRIVIGDKVDLIRTDNRLSADPDERTHVYSSQVLDESENGNMLIAMPMQEGKMIPLSVGEKIYATFYTKTGLFRCQIEVVGRYKKGTLFYMEVSQLSVMQKVQRREYYRLECHAPIEYRIISDLEQRFLEEGNAYNPDEMTIQWKQAVMLDLSGGGIHFVSPNQEERNVMLEVRFNIAFKDEIERIYVFATLLRSQRNENNSQIYDSHIKFWKLDEGTREKVIRYIFEEQRKIRLKDSGME